MDIALAPFGGIVNAALALGVVLVLILIVAWLLKLIFGASSTVARGRNRRMSVVEAMAIDPKRQLMIIRRDDVEHVILVGGAQDVVVETGIPVVEASAQPARRPLPMSARRNSAPDNKAPVPTAAPQRPLRQTGLLRAGNDAPAHKADNAGALPADSAKEDGRQRGSEGPVFGNVASTTGEANRT